MMNWCYFKKELFHYLDTTLKYGLYDAAILHVGINDLLNSNNTSIVDELISNLKSMPLKCLLIGISKVAVYGIVSNNRMSDKFEVDINRKTARICREKMLILMNIVNI